MLSSVSSGAKKSRSADTASETLVFLLLGPRHCDRRGWEHCFLMAYMWPVWQWEIGTEPRRQVRGSDWPEKAAATQSQDPHCLIVSGQLPLHQKPGMCFKWETESAELQGRGLGARCLFFFMTGILAVLCSSSYFKREKSQVLSSAHLLLVRRKEKNSG